MNFRHATIGLMFAALAGCDPQLGDDSSAGNNTVEPDNTARNARDRQTDAKTPFDQSESGSDIATTAAIRREILKTDGLSTNADNIKIITSSGMVTLRGVVASEGERETVRAIATRIAGAQDKVDMQLEIDPDGDKAEDNADDKLDDDKLDDRRPDARDPVVDPAPGR